MRSLQTSRAVLIVLIVLGLGSLSRGAEKDKKTPETNTPQGIVHTVEASVGYPTNAGVGIQAERQPGEFTIPKGTLGARLKYSFSDPKSGYASTKLRGSNIYSVTARRYMHELDKDPNFALPPGEYKFVVGGQPGASGSLAYTAVPDSGAKPPPGDTHSDPPNRKPPTRKPPPDTPQTGVQRDPLHPGGEGRRKVTVHVTVAITDTAGKTTTGSGDLTATLTVSAGKILLEFAKDMSGGVERWEGTLTRQDGAVAVQGTTTKDYSFHEGQSTTKWRGTFAGKLEGAVLKGTTTARGEMQAFGQHQGSMGLQGEWSIKDFLR